MSKKPDWTIAAVARGILEILATIAGNLMRDVFKMIAAFAIGTGASAIACWYYDLPLVLSLLGGLIVLGVALVFVTSSIIE
ncbi:MAG: hypothetical protein KDK89_11100 [Alphaproteobacteria bacterium]|nr:hypothetical protein [Alphaproteobacteria bacterium]